MDIAAGMLVGAPHVISVSLHIDALLLIDSIALMQVLFADLRESS
jgi:hypothetical protein